MRARRVKPIIIKKQAVFPWIAGLVLIIVAGVISAQIIALAKMPDYAQRQQFFQHRVEQILDRMIGRSHYVVNVGVQLAEANREVQKVQYTPRNVTEIFEQTVKSPDSPDENLPRTLSPAKGPKSVGTFSSPVEAIERLPGLAPRSTKMAPGGLPGFPKVRALSAGKSVSNQHVPQPMALSQAQSGVVQNDQIYIKQYFNENKETISFPATKIDRLSVSLVLDQARLEELNITTEDVAVVIRDTIGYIADRGDTIKMVAYPFKGLRYWVVVIVQSAKTFWDTSGHWITGLILVPFTVWLLVISGRAMMQQRKQKDAYKEHTLSQVSHVHHQRLEYQTQSQINELVSFATTSPKDFVAALHRWVTVSEEKK